MEVLLGFEKSHRSPFVNLRRQRPLPQRSPLSCHRRPPSEIISVRVSIYLFVENQGILVNVNSKNHIEAKKNLLADVHAFEEDITSFTVMQHSLYMYVGDSTGNVRVLKLEQEYIVQMKYTIPYSASHGVSVHFVPKDCWVSSCRTNKRSTQSPLMCKSQRCYILGRGSSACCLRHPSHLVTQANRRKHIATQLLDALRKSFCMGFVLEHSQLAFSQPTSVGKALASNYIGGGYFLVYKTNNLIGPDSI
ncbi:hypothetical protein L3X38_011232 [Prunus dulcis]|uniref:N-acetyltransferase ESCO acetyl-transferase domain-containing protein n=1 Tax=Prunus dulcis TaxID=3755 RepID=A0AAD4ZF78_PRUDU|nr:hypothetical protein L3X38_011232 [Prunus dulcis]